MSKQQHHHEGRCHLVSVGVDDEDQHERRSFVGVGVIALLVVMLMMMMDVVVVMMLVVVVVICDVVYDEVLWHDEGNQWSC